MSALTIKGRDGEQQEPKYYLLKSNKFARRDYISTDGKRYIACPTFFHECSAGSWRTAPGTHRNFLKVGVYGIMDECVHGRRLGSEVELFEMEDGKETEGLRDDLEKKGFTVRSWVAESTKAKFPSRGLIFKKEKDKLTRCRELLEHEIAQWEIERDEPAQYALLGDAGHADKRDKRKRLLVAIISPKDFSRHFKEEQPEVFTFRGCGYKIFGTYHDSRARWHCEDEEFMSYFFDGGEKVNCHIWNGREALQAEKDEAKKKAKKKAKKEAKKHRRKVTASAITSPKTGGNSYGALQDDGDEAEEARAQAKREKEKAKRKAYKERRRAKEEAEAVGDDNADSAESAEPGSHSDMIRLANIINPRRQPTHLIKLENGQWLTVSTLNDDESSQCSQSRRRPSSDGGGLPGLGSDRERFELLGDPSSASSEDGSAPDLEGEHPGLDVIQAKEGDDIDELVERIKGKGPVIIASQEEDPLRESGGLQYLGRGL